MKWGRRHYGKFFWNNEVGTEPTWQIFLGIMKRSRSPNGKYFENNEAGT